MNFDPDYWKIRKLDQITSAGTGKVILTGSVRIWRCPECKWGNGESVKKCNACGMPKPESEP